MLCFVAPSRRFRGRGSWDQRPGEAAGCADRSPSRAAKTRHRPKPATGDINNQANTQTRAHSQSCLPKTKEQSRRRFHWPGAEQAGRARRGPGTALPIPALLPGRGQLRGEFPAGDAQPGLGLLALAQPCSTRGCPFPEEDETAEPPLPGSATAGKALCSPGDAGARSGRGEQGDFTGTTRPELKLRCRGSGVVPALRALAGESGPEGFGHMGGHREIPKVPYFSKTNKRTKPDK